jgi:hypothetical protein
MAPTNDNPTTTIIKSDRSGRPRYTQQYKDEVLAAYEASGMSGPAFAEHCGLKYPTFATWAAKRRRETGSEAGVEPPQQFVLAEFDTAPASSELHIDLPGGSRARLTAANQIELLVTLIKSLG